MSLESSQLELPSQQDLESYLPREHRLKSCTPTAFYIASSLGGLTLGSLEDYASMLEGSSSYSKGRGWSRPGFSQDLRDWFGLSIVSWKIHQKKDLATDYESAREAGYFVSEVEVGFFNSYVRENNPAETLIAVARDQSIPMVVTVLPNFGKNKSPHSVVISNNQNGLVEIIDPDERVEDSVYEIEEIVPFLDSKGAMSVILGGYSV